MYYLVNGVLSEAKTLLLTKSSHYGEEEAGLQKNQAEFLLLKGVCCIALYQLPPPLFVLILTLKIVAFQSEI